MQTTTIESTALLRISYDVATRCLEVEFHDRSVYQYRGVTPEIHAALLQSDSKGRFLNTAIRDRFPHVRTHPPLS
jgi:hypothetical protein